MKTVWLVQILISFGIAFFALYGPDPFWSPVVAGLSGGVFSMLVEKVAP